MHKWCQSLCQISGQWRRPGFTLQLLEDKEKRIQFLECCRKTDRRYNPFCGDPGRNPTPKIRTHYYCRQLPSKSFLKQASPLSLLILMDSYIYVRNTSPHQLSFPPKDAYLSLIDGEIQVQRPWKTGQNQ